MHTTVMGAAIRGPSVYRVKALANVGDGDTPGVHTSKEDNVGRMLADCFREG